MPFEMISRSLCLGGLPGLLSGTKSQGRNDSDNGDGCGSGEVGYVEEIEGLEWENGVDVKWSWGLCKGYSFGSMAD